MNKKLIIFYSRTGHTNEVAKAISRRLEADLEQLMECRQQGLFAAGVGALLGSRVPLKNVISDPENYELVILGTPVWIGSLPPAMRTFIARYAGKFSRVAFFCTEGGRGAERVFRQMEQLCGMPPVATLEITEDELRSGACAGKIESFAAQIERLPAGLKQSLHAPQLAEASS